MECVGIQSPGAIVKKSASNLEKFREFEPYLEILEKSGNFIVGSGKMKNVTNLRILVICASVGNTM